MHHAFIMAASSLQTPTSCSGSCRLLWRRLVKPMYRHMLCMYIHVYAHICTTNIIIYIYIYYNTYIHVYIHELTISAGPRCASHGAAGGRPGAESSGGLNSHSRLMLASTSRGRGLSK